MQLPQIDPAAGPQFTVGGVLNRAWTTLIKKPEVFFGITFAALILPTVLSVLVALVLHMTMSTVSTPTFSTSTLLVFLVAAVQSICLLVSQGVIAYAVFQVQRGQPVSLGASVARVLARAPSLVLTAVLMGLGVSLGMFLLFIPGLILWTMWAVTIPACVVERLGGTAALSRSSALTSGYRWKIFALVLILAAVNIALNYLVQTIGVASNSLIVLSLVGLPASVVPQAFGAVMHATIYYDLKRIKEGVSVDSLAGVFD